MTDTLKKREQKHATKEEKAEKMDLKHRMNLNFNLFVGDDTGLIKKVKMVYNYQTDIQGIMERADISFKDDDLEDEQTKKKKQEEYSINQKFDKDGQPLFKVMQKHIAGKQTGKFGKQAKYQGITQMKQTFKDNSSLISYVRGKSNVVQVLDTAKEVEIYSKDFTQFFPSGNEIKSLIPYGADLSELKHLACDNRGQVVMISTSKEHKKASKLLNFKLNGDNVWCSQQNPAKPHEVAYGSKDQLLQIWDINKASKEIWMAKNLPNDELDLKIPIWDTSIAYLSNAYSLVACTAYSDVREYDTRGPRKPVTAVKLFGNESGKDRYQKQEIYLSKVMPSMLDSNHVYVVTQEGHPVLLDRRMNYRILKKMPGAKGSVRDAITRLVPGLDGQMSQEVVITCGCDRFVRVYDPNERYQHLTEIGHFYLKQRLNCLLVNQE